MNEILLVVTLLTAYIFTLLSYKFFGKVGLFIWIAMSIILVNLEALKCVDIFGMALTLGNVIYCTIFLATDILNEIYGKAEAKKGVYIGFFIMIAFTIMTQIDLMYIPNSQDFINENLKMVLGLMPRIAIASIGTYLVSNLIDVSMFQYIKKKWPAEKYYVLRKNGSNLVSQFVDSFLFTFVAFLGVFKFNLLIELSLTTYLIKMVLSFADIPFMYIAKNINSEQQTISNKATRINYKEKLVTETAMIIKNPNTVSAYYIFYNFKILKKLYKYYIGGKKVEQE